MENLNGNKDSGTLADVGLKIDIPPVTWVYLAAAILIPVIVILSINTMLKKI